MSTIYALIIAANWPLDFISILIMIILLHTLDGRCGHSVFPPMQTSIWRWWWPQFRRRIRQWRLCRCPTRIHPLHPGSSIRPYPSPQTLNLDTSNPHSPPRFGTPATPGPNTNRGAGPPKTPPVLQLHFQKSLAMPMLLGLKTPVAGCRCLLMMLLPPRLPLELGLGHPLLWEGPQLQLGKRRGSGRCPWRAGAAPMQRAGGGRRWIIVWGLWMILWGLWCWRLRVQMIYQG